MKKRLGIGCLVFILILSCALCVGCFDDDKKVEVEFVRFSIGARQTDYYLDFTVSIANNSDSPATFTADDFYVEINDNKINNVALLYEYTDTFYAAHVTVDSGDTLKLRVRAISTVKDKQYNTIILKYKDKTLVDDEVYISDTNK